MNRPRSSSATIALLVLSSAQIATASQSYPWDGPSLGIGLGSATASTCGDWRLSSAAVDATAVSPNPYCSSGGTFVGGLRFGEDIQFSRWVVGLGADLDYAGEKVFAQSLKSAGPAPPAGTYSFSTDLGPRGFAIIAPRVGYAASTWLLPYLRAGGLFALGGGDSTLSYTAPGAKKPVASFGGTKDFSSAGWIAGGGLEVGLNGPWTLSVEYLHASLGGSSSATASCGSGAAACAPLSGVSLETSHSAYTTNMFRVGFSYYFRYWEIE